MADVTPTYSEVDEPFHAVHNYADIPQRHHVYPTSERAERIVRESITMDSLFSAVWPVQWSNPEAPEFHDVMARCKNAGLKALARCPSADSLASSTQAIAKALEFYLKKMREHPERYKLVRTTADIDEAIAEDKLGIFFTHQGTALLGGDLGRVGLWRELGYGYCLLAYNSRNRVGDGGFEPDNGRLTGYGKLLIKAYNHYGMVVDVSHTGRRTSLDAIEVSEHPVISSHSGARAISDYPRNLDDDVIKALGESGGVAAINTVGAFMDKPNPDIVTTEMIFRHIDYLVDLIGIDHVGYGSDWIPDITFTADGLQTPMGQLIFPRRRLCDPDGRQGRSDTSALPVRARARGHHAVARLHRGGLRQVPRRQPLPRLRPGLVNRPGARVALNRYWPRDCRPPAAPVALSMEGPLRCLRGGAAGPTDAGESLG